MVYIQEISHIINSTPPFNKFNLNFKENIIDILFWNKLLNIIPIAFKCDKSFIFNDCVFYNKTNWAYHLYIPLDCNNSFLLIGFFKTNDTKINFNLKSLVFNVNFEEYYNFKNILDNLDEFVKLIILYNNYIDFQHCMWSHPCIMGEFFDGLWLTSLNNNLNLPSHWGQPNLFLNLFLDCITPYEKYEKYLKNIGVILDPLNPSEKDVEYRLNYILYN